MIDRFRGENAFLSNFWVEEFSFKGRTVFSAEHAFQAAKCAPGEGSEAARAAILAAARKDGKPSPTLAKRLGRRVPLRQDWTERRVEIMREIIECKFSRGSQLAAKLVATGEEHLIEGNDWRDDFWGCVRRDGGWAGKNMLGTLLMERREALRIGSRAG